jgi:hypothetical protein
LGAAAGAGVAAAGTGVTTGACSGLLHAEKPATTTTPAITPDVLKSFMTLISIRFRPGSNATFCIGRRNAWLLPQFPFPLFPPFVLFVIPAPAA